MADFFDRRTFILATAALGTGVAFSYLPRLLWEEEKQTYRKGFILGGGKGVMEGKEIQYLSILDLDAPKPAPLFLPMEFLGHGLAFHPQNPHVIAVFEKKGPGACEVDLKQGHVTRAISTPNERHFYGHGAYSTKGDKLYSTETVLSTGEGQIVIRDSKTMEIEGFFPSYGTNPHDCQLIENNTVIAITNGGGTEGNGPAPSVTYVEIATRKLLKKYEMTDPRFNTGHLAVSKAMDLAVTSAPRLGRPNSDLGAISLLSNEGKLTPLQDPSEVVNGLKAETLSLCIDEQRGIVAATSPAGNMVTFWKVSTGKLVSVLEIKNPRGITLTAEGDFYAISNGPDAGLLLVNAKTLLPVENQRVAKAGFSGSHLYLWTPPVIV